MFRARRLYAILSTVFLLLIGGFLTLRSQTPGPDQIREKLIRESVDNTKLVTLAGNTRPEAYEGNDLGPVSDDLLMDHMMLQLKRSPQQERTVEQFIAALHDPQSPNFHKWLTAVEFGKNFGVAESDVQTVVDWLESQGFTVNSIYPSGMVIDFSGNAGQVRRAFHTSIHNLDVNGVHHIANFSDPQIPEALAPAVAGIVSMHDFRPHKMSRAKIDPEMSRAVNKSHPQYTFGGGGQTTQAVVPADLATIYDFNPLFAKGITGMGQTIVVIEDSDLYTVSDWTVFRAAFGLSQYTSGSLTTVHPAPASGANNCAAPGVTGDDGEAILDTEWATAAAPGAAIVVGACADTIATSGLYLAALNLVNAAAPPAIMSISYGGCEAENGAASNVSINTLYQQAVAEGVSVFVAAGDEGAASCDAGQANATHGIGVSANAATQYNVAVGGTDFSDVLNNTTATYWTQNNTATYGSALSYIPEIPWNDSCAGSLFANYNGFSTGYGSAGFCNSVTNTAAQAFYVVVAAGSGGPSNCFTGLPATFGVSNGSCKGYAKPSWQTGLSGIPNDGVRDLPDVSMFASDGTAWGHYSVVCFSDPNGGAPCRGAPDNWSGFGGTSIATPVMAGTQALVNQKVGARQGNPNVVYYALAASTPSAFHPVTQGDIDVSCAGPDNCYGYLGTIDYGRGGRVFGTTYGGALSVSDTSFTSAYAAGASSWNFANGIGSVDANNLVMNWPTSGTSSTPTAPAVTFSAVNVVFGAQTVGTVSAAQTLTLTNSGTAALSIASIAITGTNSADFSETSTCGSSVATGASCTISVTFKPTAAGARAASISITDNASGSPQTISLTGTGQNAATGQGSFTTLLSFNGANGSGPAARLVQSTDGNFYGTTQLGGASDKGTVFKMTPSGSLTTLYSFKGTDGAYPVSALIQAVDGNFYGTTKGGLGGADGYGTVFKITPGGTLTTLHNFSADGSDGFNPTAALVQATDGNFYGTTSDGGLTSFGGAAFGTVFKITPAGALTTLHSFFSDGLDPSSGLFQAADGNLYGETSAGPSQIYDGTVFKITPAGVLTSLHSFTCNTDGADPDGGLIQAADGNFYGTTGSTSVCGGGGTVFKITPGGTLTTLHSFTSSDFGIGPDGPLVQAADGNFYGTTNLGAGIVFRITPGGAFTTIYQFGGFGSPDGSAPTALVQGADGNLYGTTSEDGANGYGTVFRLTLTPAALTAPSIISGGIVPLNSSSTAIQPANWRQSTGPIW